MLTEVYTTVLIRPQVFAEDTKTLQMPSIHHLHAPRTFPVAPSTKLTASNNAIASKQLTFQLKNVSTPIFQNKTYAFQHNRLHAIAGDSGSGKTTYAKVLGGVHAHPSSGEIYVNGRMCSHTPSIRQKKKTYCISSTARPTLRRYRFFLDNIRYTNTQLTDVEVHNILRHYNIHRVLGYPSE